MLLAGFLDILRAAGFERSSCAGNSHREGEALLRVSGSEVGLASGDSRWTSCDMLRALKCSNSGHVEAFGGCRHSRVYCDWKKRGKRQRQEHKDVLN